MDQRGLEERLSNLPFGSVRYYPQVSSTNDLAVRWAEAGGPHLALIVADEQTAGRGRSNRRWYTPPGSALAFSLILRGQTPGLDQEAIPRVTALGALAVCEALSQDFSARLPAQIKWPNDVVAERRKLAGVLAEAHWHGQDLQAVILGVGINVAPESLPPAETLDFPATCVSNMLGHPVDRWSILHAVLARLLEWLPRLGKPGFIQAWEQHLAFQGEWVLASAGSQLSLEGKICGLNPDGTLKLQTRAGEEMNLRFGEIHLRPVDRL